MQAKGQNQDSTGTTLSKIKELLYAPATPVVQYTQSIQDLAVAPVATGNNLKVMPELRNLLQNNINLSRNYHELTSIGKHVCLMSQVISNIQSKELESSVHKHVKRVFTQDLTDKMHESVWGVMNFTISATVISAAIVAVQNPVKTMSLNLLDKGTLLPTNSGSLLGVVKLLYSGSKASFFGTGLLRTTYVTGAKETKPAEENTINKMKYVAYITLGEVALTQISESLSQLQKKQGLLPENFNWKTRHNAYQLMVGGLAPRYFSGLINFSCLCLLSETYASNLGILGINDPVLANSLGGVGSGITAAIISYPLAALKDCTLLQATVQDGKLMNKSSSKVLKGWLQELQNNPNIINKKLVKNVGKQLLMQSIKIGLIFGIVSGLNEYLGKEPLKAIAPGLEPKRAKSPQRFFSVSAQDKSVKLPEEPSASVTQSKR